MNYYEITIPVKNLDQTDIEILSAVIFSMGCESIVDQVTSLLVYIEEDLYTEDFKEQLKELSGRYGLHTEAVQIEDRNWNEEWEKDFQPVQVEDKCMVRAPFHPKLESVQVDIVIEPKMSFGTGHHETTWLVLYKMSQLDFVGKKVLDMGSGTGVLAIYAIKLGAVSADAIDIDTWAYENCKENAATNETPEVNPLLGDASLLTNQQYDIILANINRNILVQDMHLYVQVMNPSAKLIVSGFFSNDMSVVQQQAEASGLIFQSHLLKNNWTMMEFVKV